MFLLNRTQCRRTYRMIRIYWLKCFILLLICSVIILSFLSWKYDKELTRLEELLKVQKRNIRDAIVQSTVTWKMQDTWKTLRADRAAIFSAYLDARPEVVLEEVFNAESANLWALIRIIAVVPVSYSNTQLTCYYKFFTKDNYYRTVYSQSPAIAVRIIASTENFGMSNSAAFVICKLITLDDGTLPMEITFSSNNRKTPKELDHVGGFVNVHYSNRTSTNDQDKFMTVCVPSLHHNYDKYANLIEFVEFYRVMGVEHFTFYKTSVTKEVDWVLDYYEKLNVTSVIRWELPKRYVYERNLRYNGIFAAMNDCLYRSSMVEGYKYTVNVDLDEFIVPRQPYNDFRQMMNFLDPVTVSNNNASFIFRNMFFYLMHDDDPIPQKPRDIPKLLLHTKTTRLARINPSHDRSKYIVRGQEVVEMGNHRVWHARKISLTFRTSYKETVVDPEIAGSQHYRYCEVNELVCWLRNTIRDRTAHRFTEALGNRVKKILLLMCDSTRICHL